MRRTRIRLGTLFLAGVALPFFALAQSSSYSASTASKYDMSNLPYSDAPRDAATAVSVSALTDLEVVEGHSDGTFRPQRMIDRAQFVKIVMEMLERGLVKNSKVPVVETDCFSDISRDAWYASYVCEAKAMGIVQGDAATGVPPESWRFSPSRSINYAEAVKVLSEAFNFDIPPDTHERWYVPYLTHAEDLDIDLHGVRPYERITRGEMSRLAVLFLAYQNGEREKLRNAIDSYASASSRASSTSSLSVSTSAQTSSFTSVSSSSSISGNIDTLSDTTARSQFVLLGEISPMLGAADFFSSAEPIIVKRLSVDLVSDNPNLESVLFYDQNSYMIGRGFIDPTLNGNTRYTLVVPEGRMTLPEDRQVSVYVRGDFRTANEGGTTGTDVQIHTFRVEGIGGYSNDDYTAVSSGHAYPIFRTTPAMITAVQSGGATSDILSAGADRRIGTFAFESRRTDTTDAFYIDDIAFQTAQTGDVALSDIKLGIEGTNERYGCAMTGSVIACENLPMNIGALGDGEKTFVLYADISVPSSSANASLRVSLTRAGSSSTAGDVTWFSGSQSFTWVSALTDAVDGTYYAR